jgi:hypothetical protein
MTTVAIESRVHNHQTSSLDLVETLNETGDGGTIHLKHGSTSPSHELKVAANAKLHEIVKKYKPAKITITQGVGNDHLYTHTATIEWTESQRKNAIDGVLNLARRKTCGCGSHGSWSPSDRVAGTSENVSVTWAGCDNCSSSAIGYPIRTNDLGWYERKYGELEG